MKDSKMKKHKGHEINFLDSVSEKINGTISWPKLGVKGVVVEKIKVPEFVNDDHLIKVDQSSTIQTGGIFVPIGKQELWPIRYSSDAVNVKVILPVE